MNRTDMRRARQAAHHTGQISRAQLPRHKLAAACQYLVAEAARAGDVEATKATEYVLAYVTDLRTRAHEEGNPT